MITCRLVDIAHQYNRVSMPRSVWKGPWFDWNLMKKVQAVAARTALYPHLPLTMLLIQC
jgi:hypothetical protein